MIVPVKAADVAPRLDVPELMRIADVGPFFCGSVSAQVRAHNADAIRVQAHGTAAALVPVLSAVL